MDAYLIRAVTAAEVSATAAIRFRAQYRDWTDVDKFHDGKMKGDVEEVFNTQPHTPQVIAAILNSRWAYPCCMVCNKPYNATARLREQWGEQELDICLGCLERAVLVLKGQDTSEAKP